MIPVTERTRQGWRASITASINDERQLVEVHAREASVLSVSFDLRAGVNVDDGGRIIVETRIGEAVRRRSLWARNQGFALNVPAGVTRVFCQGFTKPYTSFIQMAPGITTTERVGKVIVIPAAGANIQVSPELARLVKVTALVGPIEVVVPLGAVPLVAPQSIEIPAYAETTVNNTDVVNVATAAIEWEVTA